MKKINASFLGLFLLVIASGNLCAQDYTQTHRKEFAVTSQTTLSVANQFGLVKCENWDQPMIAVEVNITVTSRDKKIADKMLEVIEVEMRESGSDVMLKTKIGKMPGQKKNEQFRVDYLIRLPENLPLKITNEFGNIVCDNRTADFTMDLSYGGFTLRALNGENNELEISFSKGQAEMIRKASVKLSYSTFDLSKAESLVLNSEFSELNLKSTQTAEIRSSYDKINIDDAMAISSQGEFSTFKLGNIGRELKGSFNYGSASVKSTSVDFETLDVKLEFSSLNVDNMMSPSFRQVDVRTENGSFKYPAKMALKTEKKDFTSVFYTGQNQTGRAKLLKIDAEFSSIKIQ